MMWNVPRVRRVRAEPTTEGWTDTMAGADWRVEGRLSQLEAIFRSEGFEFTEQDRGHLRDYLRNNDGRSRYEHVIDAGASKLAHSAAAFERESRRPLDDPRAPATLADAHWRLFAHADRYAGQRTGGGASRACERRRCEPAEPVRSRVVRRGRGRVLRGGERCRPVRPREPHRRPAAGRPARAGRRPQRRLAGVPRRARRLGRAASHGNGRPRPARRQPAGLLRRDLHAPVPNPAVAAGAAAPGVPYLRDQAVAGLGPADG